MYAVYKEEITRPITRRASHAIDACEVTNALLYLSYFGRYETVRFDLS